MLFRGAITRLLHSLCTLRAAISVDYATLGYGCWLSFTVPLGWSPKKISKIYLSLSYGLCLARYNL